MAVCYDKLFHLMIDKKISNVQLKDMAGVSANIITRLKRDEYISTERLRALMIPYQKVFCFFHIGYLLMKKCCL